MNMMKQENNKYYYIQCLKQDIKHFLDEELTEVKQDFHTYKKSNDTFYNEKKKKQINYFFPSMERH